MDNERGRQPVTGDIARKAFDAVAAIQGVSSIDDLNRVVRSSFSALGFDVWVAFDSVDTGGQADVKILFGNTHPEWEARYTENRYDQHDAMIRASLSTNEPFFWSDITNRTTLTTDEQRVLDEAGEFRLREGFVTPMHNLDGSITAVLLTGEKIDVADPDTRAAANLLSVYFGSVGRRLVRTGNTDSSKVVRLTPRQLDCLRWARHGKSSADIGDILGISQYTADEYIRQACARLGVRTRIQAVTEAAMRGLIEL